jgi:hypothetical protein
MARGAARARARATSVAAERAAEVPELEEAFANLLPLRHFPETLYIGPALCKTLKHGWHLLRKGLPTKTPPYIPGAWSLYESNIYSFADPENSRLKRIVDLGGLDTFDSHSWRVTDGARVRAPV